MASEGVDAGVLLLGRKSPHIFLRGVAELLDVAVFGLVVGTIELFVPSIGHGLLLFCLFVSYFTVAESLFGCTLGKLICGLRVVGLNGLPPSGFQCLIRNVIRPFEAFGLLGVILLDSTRRGQRLGDLAAATFVVRKNELETLGRTQEELTTNNATNSRQVVSISPDALSLARSGIAASTRPAQTGLSVVERAGLTSGLAVQFDLLEPDDSTWQWTIDGVTISVAKEIAQQHGKLMIDAQDGKLIALPQA